MKKKKSLSGFGIGGEISSSFLIRRIVRLREFNLGKFGVAEVVNYKIYNIIKYNSFTINKRSILNKCT